MQDDGTIWGCGDSRDGELGIGYESKYLPTKIYKINNLNLK
jgi:alpha-tubulin suppressor-like RCC1 family protein